MSASKLIEVSVEIFYMSREAICVSDDGDEENAEWLPKSLIDNWDYDIIARRGLTLTIEIPEWLAEEKGFI